MKKADLFRKLMFTYMNLVMGVILVTTGMLLGGNFDWLEFAINLLVSLCVGYYLSDWIPAHEIGCEFADRLGIKGKLGKHVVSVAVLALIMITLVSLFCQFIGFGIEVVHIWPKMYPKLLLVGYIGMLIAVPLGNIVVTSIVDKIIKD